MFKNIVNSLLIILIVLLGIELFLWQKIKDKDTKEDTIKQIEAEVKYDTNYTPVAKDSVVLLYITEVLPIADTNITEVLPIADTIKKDTIREVIKDSVKVEIPITQKMYKDSNYTAYVSGFKPNLDSLIIVNKTITETIKPKPKKWGLGLQVGYGVTSGLKQSFYIGVGVSYNILNF